MVNAIYRAAMTELEAVLSPRVVSSALNIGLKQVGKSPKDVEYGDMEKIFKSQVYKQLQVAMDAEKAKEKINDILEKLEDATDEVSGPPPFLEQQARTISALKKVFKSLSLYFQWPEVQKARALLKLIEEDHNNQKEASQLIANARAQLKKAEEKLNDQLVQQDAEIQRLEEMYEIVKDLGGSKARRLDRLIGQIDNAQVAKQLAPAELERARKLADELHKLALAEEESTSDSETSEKASKDKVKSEATDDLLVNTDNQIYQLEVLSKDFTNLLVFKPELAHEIEDAKRKLKEGSVEETFIVKLREYFKEEQNHLRKALKVELDDILKDILSFDDELDSKQLKQNLQVTLDILENVLPAEADVREIRDLYRLLKQRANEFAETKAQEHEAFEAKLKQQGESLEQLRTMLEKYDPKIAKKEYDLLANKLDLLTKAQVEKEIATDILDDARFAAEGLEAVLLKQSLSESQHQEAYLIKLLMQVQAVPSIKAIESQGNKVIAELKKSLKQLDSKKDLKPKRMQQIDLLVGDFKDKAKLNYKNQLSELKERAEGIGSKKCLKSITEAQQQLEVDKYPDLEEFERALKNAFDERLTANLDELHQLEAEREQITATEDEEVKQLDVLLKRIREQLEKGDLAEGIDHCWLLLESLRNKQDQALTSFEPRLDKALKDFSNVSKLNNDASTTVSRILRHLDGQRKNLSKVSAEMRSKLENSLSEAERLLKVLEAELEAASAVAGKLMSGNIFDNVFGLDTSSDTSKVTTQSVSKQPKVEDSAQKVFSSSYSNQALDEVLNDYLRDDGVRDAVIFNPEGEMLSGSTLLEPKELFNILKRLENNWQVLGEELTLGQKQLFTIETPKLTFIASYPKENYTAAIVLDKPSSLTTTLEKMRSGLPLISEILSGPAFT